MSNSPDVDAIRDQSIAEAEATCTWPWVLNYERPLPGTSLNVHHIMMIVVAAAAIVNISIASYLLVGHLRHWTRPHEQKQYTRIILFPIILSLTSFFAVLNYHAADQIEPVGQLYEGIAIAAIFLLYIQIISPNANVVDSMNEIESHDAKAKRTWKIVMQIVPVRFITFIAFEVLFGVACPTSKHRKTGSTVITVFEAISTTVAIISIVAFQRRNKPHLVGHKTLWKLAAFKGVIALQVIQNIIFSALRRTDVFVPSPPFHVSYNDLARGLPRALFAWELVIASITFLWAFEFQRFRAEIRGGALRASGMGGALMATLNLSDVVRGTVYAVSSGKEMNDVEYSRTVMKREQRDSSERY